MNGFLFLRITDQGQKQRLYPKTLSQMVFESQGTLPMAQIKLWAAELVFLLLEVLCRRR